MRAVSKVDDYVHIVGKRASSETAVYSCKKAIETKSGLDNTGGDGEQKDSYPLPSEQKQMERDKQGNGESNE